MGMAKTQELVAIRPKGKKQEKKAATAAEENRKTKPVDPTKPQDQPSSSGGLESAYQKKIKKRILGTYLQAQL